MSDTDLNILSIDLYKNVEETVTTITSYTMEQRMGMWGEGEFGTIEILGTGHVIQYITGEGRHILSLNLSKNVLQSHVLTVSITMSTRMGMWGEAQFGSSLILGTGTLIVS